MSAGDECSDCKANAGLCAHHAEHLCPRLAQPHWYRLVGTHYRDAEQDAQREMSPEARKVYLRKQRKGAKRGINELRQAIGLLTHAEMEERRLRTLELDSLRDALMDEQPKAA